MDELTCKPIGAILGPVDDQEVPVVQILLVGEINRLCVLSPTWRFTQSSLSLQADGFSHGAVGGR